MNQDHPHKNITFVKKRVEEFRNKLLDTSKRNNLISFRHTERSRQHIRIIDELPDFLYTALLDGKTFIFKALPEDDKIPADEKTENFRRHFEQAKLTDDDYRVASDAINQDEDGALDKAKKIENDLRNKVRAELGLPARENLKRSNSEIAKKHGIDPSYDIPIPDDEPNKAHHDKHIQTLLKPTEMGRKLSGLNSYIRTDIQESGVNTLYVAFGFLQWYESKTSDKPFFAPLLLLQLEIKKEQSREGYIYKISATGEEPEINLSLSELLQKDFGIKLPKFAEDDTPEKYMKKVARQIKKPETERWRIRRFITMGRFRFARLVMFHDLSEKKWPANAGVATNNIVQHLFAGTENESSGGHAEDYDIDTPEVESAVPLLITDADASQHSALVDVMSGKNTAIKGPPGTGKSQTITNIIANALAKGKTVLFLAEKMAALNVVHKRLSDASLGSYCLELHSTKAKKAEVLKSIKARLELRPSHGNSGTLDTKISEFKYHRDRITEYINVLNSKFGQQGKTIHDYLWGMQRRKDGLGDLLPIVSQIKPAFAHADLPEAALTAIRDNLVRIGEYKREVAKESHQGRHPWRFVGEGALNPFQQDELRQLVKDWLEQIKTTDAILKDLARQFKLDIEPANFAVDSFLKNTAPLIDWAIDEVDQTIIAHLGSADKAGGFLDFVVAVDTFKSVQAEIHTVVDIPAAIEQIKDIKNHILSATDLGVETLSVAEIQSQIKTLEADIKLWQDNLDTLLNLGKNFGVSSGETLEKIYAVADIPDYISEVPRDYLLFRTPYIINETNGQTLKAAADAQSRIRNQIEQQEADFDMSQMPATHDIRAHVADLRTAGFFAIFNADYRKAKKFYQRAAKNKTKFNADTAAKILSEISSAKEEVEKINQDKRLGNICGASFDGINTDFEKLQKINEWATGVRKRYAGMDEFNIALREWLLNATIEELDFARTIAEDAKFIAIKEKIATMRGDVSPDTSVKKYLAVLKDKSKKLHNLTEALIKISANDDINFADIASDLPHLQKAKEVKAVIDENKKMKSVLGKRYAGANTDTQDIKSTVEFIKGCLNVADIKDHLPAFFNKDFAKGWRDFIVNRAALEHQYNAVKDHTTRTQTLAPIHLAAFQADSWEQARYDILIAHFTAALAAPNSLNHWINLNSHTASALQEPLTGELLRRYENDNLDFATLPQAFDYMIYSAITGQIYTRHPIIDQTSGLQIEQARAQIKQLDQQIVRLQKDKLCSNLNVAEPLSGNRTGSVKTWTEAPLIHKEVEKQKAHIPIRDLMNRAGRSIQNIKPCFLMSPMTVAQYLTPDAFTFDLVVIDEASQMRPEDALGSIARAKQIVVVGDPQQLPPTSFFKSSGTDDEELEEDFQAEAIMDMALSTFRPSRILNRHYRSQHESLIAFSNKYFYGDSLVVFPSPVKDPEQLGVRLEYIETRKYISGSNTDEVEAIVKAATDFMCKHPDRSLGIAAMNKTQADLIEVAMDFVFINNSRAAEYRTKWHDSLESFFVKNLENVQGDERDAIFISTVYGPDKSGAVMQRFGPINQANGHRRLNVLFTRAKKNMVIFTSLKPNEITISNTSSQGLVALKNFLIYAQSGQLDAGVETHREADSDFEIWVKERLETIGCTVHPQVGVGGYRIDLGVKHPKYPHGYLLGIECDGATYHSSKSARERDVIRQQVLEGLGWRIYRIWSTDWFSNPVREFEKLCDYIKNLLDKGT